MDRFYFETVTYPPILIRCAHMQYFGTGVSVLRYCALIWFTFKNGRRPVSNDGHKNFLARSQGRLALIDCVYSELKKGRYKI